MKTIKTLITLSFITFFSSAYANDHNSVEWCENFDKVTQRSEYEACIKFRAPNESQSDPLSIGWCENFDKVTQRAEYESCINFRTNTNASSDAPSECEFSPDRKSISCPNGEVFSLTGRELNLQRNLHGNDERSPYDDGKLGAKLSNDARGI